MRSCDAHSSLLAPFSVAIGRLSAAPTNASPAGGGGSASEDSPGADEEGRETPAAMSLRN